MITRSSFKPAWWLPGPHLQTLWPTFFRLRPSLDLRFERLDLADGDFLDLAWVGENQGPLVLVLHGLEGCLQSHYASGVLESLDRAGLRPVFMHFRGCSGVPNRLPRSYHSGDTGDLAEVMSILGNRYNANVDAVVGFSLGGNVLLKWLGEQGPASRLKAAVAVSVPLLLDEAAARLERGFSRFYQRHLLRRLRRSYDLKFSATQSPLAVNVNSLKTFRDFDDKVTAPLHGFENVDDYYRRCSSRQFLKNIATPTLIIHAMDDPFMFPTTVPDDTELSSEITLELSVKGGHVGFVDGAVPFRPRYWLDKRITSYLSARLMPDRRVTFSTGRP